VGIADGEADGEGLDTQLVLVRGSATKPSMHLHVYSTVGSAVPEPVTYSAHAVLLVSHPWGPSSHGCCVGEWEGAMVGVTDGASVGIQSLLLLRLGTKPSRHSHTYVWPARTHRVEVKLQP
jgi:hypothetical protein